MKRELKGSQSIFGSTTSRCWAYVHSLSNRYIPSDPSFGSHVMTTVAPQRPREIPRHEKPTRPTPGSTVYIQEASYKNGQWVADLNVAYIIAKRRCIDNYDEERNQALASCLGVRKQIACAQGQASPVDDSGQGLMGGYFALCMPHYARKARSGGWYITTSQFHHWSLYYAPPGISDEQMWRFESALRYELERFVRFKANPEADAGIRRAFNYARDNFKAVDMPNRGSRLVAYLTHADMVNLPDDCIPVHKPRETTLERLKYVSTRDKERVNKFKALELKLSETSDPADVRLLEVTFDEQYKVDGEARVLLTYLEDQLYHLGAYYVGDLADTALLGPRDWHVSQQDRGKAMYSPTPRDLDS